MAQKSLYYVVEFFLLHSNVPETKEKLLNKLHSYSLYLETPCFLLQVLKFSLLIYSLIVENLELI